LSKELFQEYVFGKQTLKQLADKYGTSKRTIQRYLDQFQENQLSAQSLQSVVIGIDCSFFGRGYGIIVVRCPGLKQNLYWKEITTENKAVYEEAMHYLEATGFNIQAVVLDAKHGIKDVFSDRVVQPPLAGQSPAKPLPVSPETDRKPVFDQ
jgi:predicted DNA-binding transcriptional regulator YafY